MYKLLLIITAGRHGSTTLCDKLDVLDNCKSFYEAFRGKQMNTSENGPWMYKSKPNEFFKCKFEDDIKKAVFEECKELGIKEEFISCKLFPHHLGYPKLKNLLSSSDNMKVIFLRREYKDSYKSMRRAQLTGNWGTTPERQERINKKRKINIKELQTIQDTIDGEDIEDYKQRIDEWFLKCEKFCKENDIPIESVYFDDVISDTYDVSKLLF
tara:strand:+ start:438 stop:1073 length:636 start_codon:yes stop_codon:yes gene_type:complete